MTCHNCNSRCKKFGKHRNGLQRYRCRQCSKTFTEDHAPPLAGMYTNIETASKAIELLAEGCSLNMVERVTELHHTTILSLLVLVGEKCERLLEPIFASKSSRRHDKADVGESRPGDDLHFAC